MGKRKDAARAIDSTEQTDKTGKPEKPQKAEAGIERTADPLPGIESPDLVPPQNVSAEGGTVEAASEPRRVERIDPPADLPAPSIAAEVVTVSFEQAAADAAPRNDAAARKSAATAAYLRTRRFIPLAATIAIAAAVGAMAGALASTGMSRLIGSDETAQSATQSRLVQEAIAKIGADVAALKTNVESSTKSASAQFARLGERLDRADRAQAESTGKLAKLTESLDRRSGATTAAGDPVVTGSIPANPPPQLHAPATRPAGQPIVEGWSLRNVTNGAAIIQGRIGLVEVEPGDSLPGLGRIEAIRRLDGRWVVVTSRGLIIAR